MFSRSDGPTALRADLVRALAFSVQQSDLETLDGKSEPAVAALAGVWNGRKGFVALVVYRISSQTVERYVFSEAIHDEDELGSAVEEGLGFAESLGFGMDSPEFTTLDVEQQEQRLHLWNKLRKPRPGIAAQPPLRAPQAEVPPAPVAPIQPVPPPEPLHHAGDIDPLATVTPVTPPPVLVQVQPAVNDPGRAVLGRIELVRRDSEESRPDPLSRLLSHL
jgi:hypothetical protein